MSRHEEEILEDSFPSDTEFDEEADESSSDIDAKLEEEDVFDVEFFKCYSALKKKDEKIYNKDVKFFEERESSSEDQTSDGEGKEKHNKKDKNRKTKEPRMTLIDHQLSVEQHDIDEPCTERVKVDLNEQISKSFYEKELEAIKKSIEKIGDDIDSESDNDLLVLKEKNQSEPSKKFNKIRTILDKIEDQEDEDLGHLKKVWNDPNNLSQEDRFLRDYILNKRYLQNSTENDEDADDEDDQDGFFSKNIDQLSDVEDQDQDKGSEQKQQVAAHHSDEKDFDKIVRIPRNSTKTIRDLVEKQEKKEKRLKKIEKEKKKKRALKNADCEDILGDLPTRFHYRETEPNDFGLTAQELLLATDEELDNWISLRDCVAYKTPEEEMAQKRKFDSMRNDLKLKKKIFKSIYGDSDDHTDNCADHSTQAVDTTKKKKKRGAKKRKRCVDSESSIVESADAIKESSLPNRNPLEGGSKEPQVESNRQRKKRKKTRGLNHKKFPKVGVAPDRLLSYGLSKTKLKKSKIL